MHADREIFLSPICQQEFARTCAVCMPRGQCQHACIMAICVFGATDAIEKKKDCVYGIQ